MSTQKKLETLLVLLCAWCLIGSANAQQKQNVKKKQIDKKKTSQITELPQNTVRGTYQPRTKGINPAVVGLRSEMIRMISTNTAEIKIIGTMQNIGTEEFVSGKNQQAFRLYEKAPGASERVVGTKNFISLKPGQKLTVEYIVQWTGSVEFPASFLARIDYDPDIFADNNQRNDDTRLADNKLELTGAKIKKHVQQFLASGGVNKSSGMAQVQMDPSTMTVQAPFTPKFDGIDPAAIRVVPKMVRKLSSNSAQIKLVGVVQNVGSQHFVSGPNQQSVRMYEKVPGRTVDRVVATKAFTRLNSGDTLMLEYSLPWSSSVEFPADFRVQIDYDPDIYSDSTTQNDDARTQNNSVTIKGTRITKKVRDYVMEQTTTGGKKKK